MAVSRAVLVYLCILLKYVSTFLILDCGWSNVSTVEGKAAQLRCTGINAAEAVEWRHIIPGGTANEIIVSTCQDQNVCTDNSPSRYRATRPASNTSVLTIVSVSRDDTARWTCQAGGDQDTCSMPVTIYPADVTENCTVTVKEESVEVSCTIYKAYPSPTCTWSEYFYPADRLSLLNDTYMEPPKTFIENGNLYYNTSCRVFRNVTKQVGTFNYTVVIYPGAVVRSSVVAVGSGSRSSAIQTTPSSATTSEATTPSTTKSEDTTSEVPSAPAAASVAVSALVPHGVIGIGVGAVVLVAIVIAVTCIIYKRRLKRIQRNGLSVGYNQDSGQSEGPKDIIQNATHIESLDDGRPTTNSARFVNTEGVYDEILEPDTDSLPTSAAVDEDDQYLTPVNACVTFGDGYVCMTNPTTEDREPSTLPSPPALDYMLDNDNGYLLPALRL
ncbi:uncharacterized protein LOC112561830 isoform X2 [Pomacea canaliculata]|uniref:uncharacterized protein LOC112561830 isoform X2 n=1 Tax=Pomacea canaliculata TaxID=400727 RepID=UPI000D7399E5|nr:uncharacterized protein LOC112561830 isoform X2 [Pomacea canaliculata]